MKARHTLSSPVKFSAIAAACACLLFSPRQSYALDPAKAISDYAHRVWKSEDGLSQNIIRCMLQTRDGYLWLATQGGLVQFDGVKFTTFDMKETKAIRNNFVTALYEDADGVLWISTHGGLTRLKDREFSVYTTAEGLPNNVVGWVGGRRDGGLWVGIVGTGLCQFKDGVVATYTSTQGLAGDNVYATCEGRDGSLWIGTNAGLSRMKDGIFTSYTKANGLPANIIRALCETSDGALWIGTYGGGLSRYSHGRFETFGTKQGLSNDRVYSLYEDREGSLWIGTDGGGLNRFRNGTFAHYTSKEGLATDRVHFAVEDREGNLWIGTDGGGLNQLRDAKLTTYASRTGLSDDMVRTILEGRDGSIWIGLHSKGLNRIQNGRTTSYTVADGLSSDVIWSLYEDTRGAMWIGTFGAGVNRFKDGKFTSYSTRNGLSNDMVRVIRESRNGDIWIGTDGGGLNRLRNGKVTVYTTRDGLLGNVIRDIREVSDGSLWIGTDGGLNRLADGKFTGYPVNNMIYAIYPDTLGSLWFGTSGGGLGRLRDGAMTFITTDNGLFDNSISGIVEDGRGNFWIGSSKGVFRTSKEELEKFADGKRASIDCTAYGEADGMESSECNSGSQPSALKTRDGRIWFPTIKGAVAFDPNNIKMNSVPPPVVIERLVVDDMSLVPGKVSQLPPGKGRIEIHYAALSLIAPERVNFKYKLEGFDENWVDAGTRREAYYTNLHPGNYHFRVIACNNDGVWNESGASLAFSLQPHFYETYLFYALVVLLVGLSGVGLYRTRIRQVRLREQELAVRVDERTKELQQEMRERKRAEEQIAASLEEKVVLLKEAHHRVKNNLQVISSFLSLQSAHIQDPRAQEVFKESENRIRSMAMIHEKLYRSKDLAHIDTGEYFEALITSIFRSYQAGADVALQVDVQDITLDPDTAIPCGLIINELVSNSLKYAFPQRGAQGPGSCDHPDQHGNRITVEISSRPDQTLVLTVSDNGVGLPEGFDYRNTTSLGLSLVNLLAEQLGGTVEIDGRNGARFTITFRHSRGG